MKLLTEQRLRELADELYDVIGRINGVYGAVYGSFNSRHASLNLHVATMFCRLAADYMREIRPPSTPKLRRMQAKETAWKEHMAKGKET